MLLRFKKVVFGLSSIRLFRALLKGVGASIEHRSIIGGLTFDTVIDVGANKGQFALLVQEIAPLAEIISFEPLQAASEVYDTVLGSHPNCKLFNLALGEKAGKKRIHISNKDDSSSLLPITALQNNLFPGTFEKSSADVEQDCLDSLLTLEDLAGHVLLKIDVQGYELEVLKGASTLLAGVEFVYVELSFMELYAGQPNAIDIISFLHSFNFVMSGVYNISSDAGRTVQADFLFAKAGQR